MDISQIFGNITLFVFVFSLLFLLKQAYGIYKAMKTDGADAYTTSKYTALEAGLSIAYIVTYLLG